LQINTCGVIYKKVQAALLKKVATQQKVKEEELQRREAELKKKEATDPAQSSLIGKTKKVLRIGVIVFLVIPLFLSSITGLFQKDFIWFGITLAFASILSRVINLFSFLPKFNKDKRNTLFTRTAITCVICISLPAAYYLANDFSWTPKLDPNRSKRGPLQIVSATIHSEEEKREKFIEICFNRPLKSREHDSFRCGLYFVTKDGFAFDTDFL